PDARLVIAGDGPLREKLMTFARAIRKAREVSFIGAVDDPVPLLRSAELCWVPSQGSCGRQVVLDAMACGCPVIAADVPCLREIVRDGQTGLLARSGDVVSLCRQTRVLFEDATLRSRLARTARTWVETQHEAGHVAQHWAQLYERCAA